MKTLIQRLFQHDVLTCAEARRLMAALTGGNLPEALTAALLAAFSMRSPRVDELIGFRQALIEAAVPVDLSDYGAIDIVGTGGDGKNTFNISTCACFVVAAAGYPVAKHGNYGATSVSGASNVLEHLGVRFTTDESRLRRSLEGCRMAYLHAPLFHPALRHVAAVRKALPVRTLFNLLGPLVNPCRPACCLLGVADLAQMRLYTHVLSRLEQRYAVVNNLDGYDEISLTDEFKIMTHRYEAIYAPADLGFSRVARAELAAGGSVADAARTLTAVLQNRATPAQTDCVLINASFAIQAHAPELPITECVEQARHALRSGQAWATFKQFVELNA